MKIYRAEVFDSTKHELGEGTVYDPRYKRYSWVDITGQRVWTMIDGKKECFSFEEPIGAAVPIADSKDLLLCAKEGLYRLANGTTIRVFDTKTIFDSEVRSNDAKADPRGRLVFGSSLWDESGDKVPHGNLYCMNGGEVRILEANTKISNGMAWNKERTKMYFSDSLEHVVFVYDYDDETGNLSNRRVLFEVTNGVSDGLTIDTDDNLWVAIWGGNRVEHRDGRTGEKIGEIAVPAQNVTCCCFSGDDMDTLLITTAAVNLSGPMEGWLYQCKVDAKGFAPNYLVL